MDQAIVFQQHKAIGRTRYLPAISIITPFQPVVTKKRDLEHRLMLLTGKIEKELVNKYSAEYAVPVILKLKTTIRNLNYNSHKKSIAIFVSPVLEKVYHLDFEVEENIVVNDSFHLRDIVFNKKKTTRYLLMLLGNESCKMYVGNIPGFQLIKSNTRKSTPNDFPREMDHDLSIILKAYPLPVFLAGTKTVLGAFKKISTNKNDIIQYIELCSEITDLSKLQNIIFPFEADWENLKQKYLLNQIEKAGSENKLSLGFEDVWAKAMQNKNKLLVLAKKYLTPKSLNRTTPCNITDYVSGNPFYIQDEVDEIIDKVFESGGDVEFINEAMLKNYKQIALIKA